MVAITLLDSATSATRGLEFASATGGTVVTDTTVLASGAPRSYKFTTSGAGVGAFIRQAGVLAAVGRRISMWRQWSALPTATCGMITAQTSGGAANVFAVRLRTDGKLDIAAAGASAKVGTTVLSASGNYRLGCSYVITSASNFTINVYLNGVLEVSMTNADGTLTNTAAADMAYGWNTASTGNSLSTWAQHIYIDDSTALTDPGDVRVTAKLPASVNNDTWSGTGSTGGTGAVNDRPLNESNYRMEPGTVAKYQDYTLEAASSGDADITEATIVGYSAWIWSKISATTGSPVPKLVDNGSDIAITLTTSPALYTHYNTTASYPNAANGIGMKSSGAAGDTFLYECGALIAFLHPITRTLSPTGSVASSGTAGKQASKSQAGSVASAGVSLKQSALTRAGSIVSAASLGKQANKVPAGSVASAGALGKAVSRALAGALATAGGIVKQVSVRQSGTLTSAGVLATSKLLNLALSGAIASAGTLTKSVGRTLAGSLATAGVVVNHVQRSFAGSVASAGSLGKLASLLRAGSVASSGSLARLVEQTLSGAMALSGVLVKQASTSLSGLLASVGDLVTDFIPGGGGGTLYTLAVDGVLATAGGLSKLASKIASGVVASSGAISKQAEAHVTGAMSPSGALARLTSRILDGSLALAGSIGKIAQVSLFGAVTISGSLAKTAAKAFTGLIASLGDLLTQIVTGVPSAHGSVTLESRVVGLTLLSSRLVGDGALSARSVGSGAASSRAVGGATVAEREAGGGSITLEDR